jgi:aarF domain-containing kinase
LLVVVDVIGDVSSSKLVATAILRSVYLIAVFTPPALLLPLLWFDRTERWWWRVALHSLASAGPCFLKFGQWAATRPDLFDPRTCERLSELHDNCPEHTFEQTRAIVEDALGKPLEQVFSEFGHRPIASGTVAQVCERRGVSVVFNVLACRCIAHVHMMDVTQQ